MRALPCPRCRTELEVAGVPGRAACPACREDYECLYLRAPERGPRRGSVPRGAAAQGMVCTHHPANASIGRCRECRKAVCAVCAFVFPGGQYCPDCAVNPRLGGGSTAKAVGSVGLSVVSILAAFGLFMWGVHQATQGAVASKNDEVLASVLGVAILLASFGGLALGFIARDEARGAGGPVAVVGIILNVLISGLFLIASVVGTLAGK